MVFGVVLVAAAVLFRWLASDQSFYLDEWDFLAGRDGGSLHDLLRPHNEHWSTIPIVAYRALWWAFGARTYVPYQACTIALHLTAAVLLRAVMRRCGVGPWVATAAASVFALLGAGREDVVWAFQIGFTGSLVCGLGQLLLADHDGRVRRRDAWGLVVGFLGLLCSGVAVTMTVAVGLALLLRRGWRAALLHTVPLGVLWLGWYAGFGRDSYTTARRPTGTTARFVGTGLGHLFAEIGQLPGVGLVLGLVLVAGLVLAVVRPKPGEGVRALAPALALAAAAVVFYGIAGVGRAVLLGPDTARASRYVHIGAALVLPAVAVALTAIGRRWRATIPALALLLVIGVPGNISAIRSPAGDVSRGDHGHMAAVAFSPALALLAADDHPLTGTSVDVITVGWLRTAAVRRKFRRPDPDRPELIDDAALTLLFDRRDDHRLVTPCAPLTGPVRRTLARNQAIRFDGPAIRIRYSLDGEQVGRVRVPERAGTLLRSRIDGLDVEIEPPARGGPTQLCG